MPAMPEELRPGVMTSALDGVMARARMSSRTAFAAWLDYADAVANRKVREGGAHRVGTPTTAVRGGGPAVISGDLSRSVRQTEIVTVGPVLTARVGPADVPHRRTNATCGEIGEYLEKKGYMFLGPAAVDARDAAPRILAMHLRSIG